MEVREVKKVTAVEFTVYAEGYELQEVFGRLIDEKKRHWKIEMPNLLLIDVAKLMKLLFEREELKAELIEFEFAEYCIMVVKHNTVEEYLVDIAEQMKG